MQVLGWSARTTRTWFFGLERLLDAGPSQQPLGYTPPARDADAYSPGAAYVDIAALDVSNSGYTSGVYSAMLAGAGGKPIGVAECELLPPASVLAICVRASAILAAAAMLSPALQCAHRRGARARARGLEARIDSISKSRRTSSSGRGSTRVLGRALE